MSNLAFPALNVLDIIQDNLIQILQPIQISVKYYAKEKKKSAKLFMLNKGRAVVSCMHSKSNG